MLLEEVIIRGTRAGQPAANTVAEGSLYGVTDEGNIIERSNGATWDPYSPTAAGLTAITSLTGNITATGPGAAVATIANDAVTYAKMQNVSAASRLLGRGSAGGAGDVEEIILGTGLTMTGTTLSSSGSGAPTTSTYLTVANETADLPNSRRVLAGTNITFDDTVANVRTINASGGGGGDVVKSTITLTEAQFELLNTTPFTLVAAQGANTIIIPLYWTMEVDLTASYVNNPIFSIAYAIAPTLNILYTYTLSINGATGTRIIVGANNNPTDRLFVYGTTDPRNSALVIRANADPNTGAATAKVHIAYMVMTTF